MLSKIPLIFIIFFSFASKLAQCQGGVVIILGVYGVPN